VLSQMIADILNNVANRLDRASALLRRWATAIPRHRLPAARLVVIGGRRYVMMDDRPHLIPTEDA
jgi:hypothetical protein